MRHARTMRWLSGAAFLLLLTRVPADAPDCGEAVARWGQHATTGAAIDFRESQGSMGFAFRALVSLDPSAPLYANYRELCRGRAVDLLAEEWLAAEARRRGVELPEEDAEQARRSERTAAMDAFACHARSLYVATAEAADAGEQAPPAGEALWQLRAIIRRKGDGIDAEAQRTLLDDVRGRLLAGDMTPERAVFLHSQAESARGGGLMEPRALEEMPPNTRAAVAGLREGEWTEVLESGRALSLLQVVEVRERTVGAGEVARREARAGGFARYLDGLALKELGVSTDDPAYGERAAGYARAHGLAADFPPECVRAWAETMLLADAYCRARALELWEAADDKQRRAWFAKHQRVFQRFWTLDRIEYALAPAEPRLAFARSLGEVEEIWKRDVAPVLARYGPGSHIGPPIPEGWTLRVTPRQLQFIVEPSADTPTPPGNPAWRNGEFTCEDRGIVRREGGSEEPLYEWEEVGAAQREERLMNELAVEVRKEAAARAAREVQWLGPLR